MQRYFTWAEAEAILPSVAELIRQAVYLKNEHDQAQSEEQAFHRRIAMSGGMLIDRSKMLRSRSKRDATVMRLREILGEIQGLGVQVKDLEKGLLDFPTLYHGEVVLLCWKLGEEGIKYWHNLTDGFPGRREIDSEFLENHRGRTA
jgi:hypothetical protein